MDIFVDIFVSLLGDVALMKTHVPTHIEQSAAVSRGRLHITSDHINQSPSAMSTSYTVTVSGRQEHFFKRHFNLIFIRNEGGVSTDRWRERSTRLNTAQVFLTSFIVICMSNCSHVLFQHIL